MNTPADVRKLAEAIYRTFDGYLDDMVDHEDEKNLTAVITSLLNVFRAKTLEDAATYLETHCGVGEFFSNDALRVRKHYAQEVRRLITDGRDK